VLIREADMKDVTDAVKADLDERTRRGVQEYGVTLGDAGLTEREILQHAYEEALDLAQYLKTRLLALE
tara:strand:+ start:2871 stop:3074 length:204 start_codon:yes stop_codon:yes gene_type:complete